MLFDLHSIKDFPSAATAVSLFWEVPWQVKEVAYRAKTDTLIAWKTRNIALILQPKKPWNPLETFEQRGWIYIVTQLIHRAETKTAQCLIFPSKSTLYDKIYSNGECKIKAQKHLRRRWRENFCINNRLAFLLQKKKVEFNING